MHLSPDTLTTIAMVTLSLEMLALVCFTLFLAHLAVRR